MLPLGRGVQVISRTPCPAEPDKLAAPAEVRWQCDVVQSGDVAHHERMTRECEQPKLDRKRAGGKSGCTTQEAVLPRRGGGSLRTAGGHVPVTRVGQQRKGRTV